MGKGQGMDGAFFLVILAIAVWFCIWLPASMAATRGRSVVGWLFLTLIFSPVFTILALLVLGPTVRQVLREERRARAGR